MDVPPETSCQTHNDAEDRGKHRQHKQPALLGQSRHGEQRDRQCQHGVREIKLIVMKVEFIVCLVGFLGFGLLNFLLLCLLAGDRLIRLDLFVEDRLRLRRGCGRLRG